MNNIIKLPIGEDVFKNIISSKFYYIDKTEFIYDLFCHQAKAILITRPRRFGKTLLMSMLSEFLSIDGDEKLFTNLKIKNHPEVCKEWMNKFPVIFISFKGIDGDSFDELFTQFKRYISYLAVSLKSKIKQANKESSFLSEDLEKLSILSNPEKEKPSKDLISESLFLFSKMNYILYGVRPVILIDEYDVPLAKAEKFGYHDSYLYLIRNMFHQALKTNEYLNFAILTGCLKISKESIFTGLNNILCCDISSDFFYDCCGFTENDINKILSDTNFTEYSQIIKEWYDGYIFGDNREIYCPWDVINYIYSLSHNKSVPPKSYWEGSSENDIVKRSVQILDSHKKEMIEILINRGCINVDLIDNITYKDLNNREFIWTFLYMTGYLTICSNYTNKMPDKICLTIPNKGILNIFKKEIKKWNLSLINDKSYKNIFLSFWKGDDIEAQKLFCEYIQQSISFYDNVEAFYHGFFLEFCNRTGLIAKSNREAGEGRCDIYIKNNQRQEMIIFELKWVRQEKKLREYANIALNQILDKEYYREFKNEYKRFLCYGISFSKKNCAIELKIINL